MYDDISQDSATTEAHTQNDCYGSVTALTLPQLAVTFSKTLLAVQNNTYLPQIFTCFSDYLIFLNIY